MKNALEIVNRFYPDVKKIVDSRSNKTIEVTKKDCLSRAVKNHKECALAQACKREFDGAIIGMKVAYIVEGEKATRYIIPASVSREITAFDRNAPFEPGIYQLSSVPETARLGSNKNKKKDNRTGRKRLLHRTENVREY